MIFFMKLDGSKGGIKYPQNTHHKTTCPMLTTCSSRERFNSSATRATDTSGECEAFHGNNMKCNFTTGELQSRMSRTTSILTFTT